MPIHSMTGFARASAQHGNYNWTWEVRSVNGKGLDVRLRLPSGFDALDLPTRNAIAAQFKRGNMSVSLNVNHNQVQAGYQVNHQLLQQLVEVMKDIQTDLPDVAAPSVDGLMGIRGVIEAVEESESDEERDEVHGVILASLKEALSDLSENRAAEGARMETVLNSHIDEIETLCGKAEACASAQPAALKARLVRQLKDVMEDLPELDEERISQEAAVLMTKADVREELDRLRAHIEGARELMGKGSPCGRKLDFLCQEFNREANTLCSKAQDVDLTRIGLDFKAVIDQFREQVQNIE
ncbi:YicC/YloC family endoribonuclease [Terasakiella sp. A23]|uniref:YicC/YloC family endoribonuclease n=1 Tax=Terasakiella sp. FCG-A23 TaxID=3080561 RepID=UPI00295472F1|nr:YicC/YloC family endoribonuclease [Terasakiella sp. A23]MDV7340618.1 YicC/YloC family endoribonuclease [Terasakiella sp. A23]